ncbi:MAG: alpha-L-rhamnosidase C-terminal domain-containing protein [Polyangiaceae bacterium]|nr:alpha-L-rhamnosidase C-terminal domain-containing protein [Polyangiaceae bacterium]
MHERPAEFAPSARLLYPAPTRFSAHWIAPEGALHEYGVYLFRCVFALEQVPTQFVVRVSADNRYQLYVNGVRVARGPSRGSIEHWHYETLDISAYLKPGANALAAMVWNHGESAPLAQISLRTAFLVDGETPLEQALVNTGKARWLCVRDSAYSPVEVPSLLTRKFFAVGKGERIDASLHPWGWQDPTYDDAAWADAVKVVPAGGHNDAISDNAWMLEPRNIPLMEEKFERILRLREARGIDVPGGFPANKCALVVPPNTRVELLLDQSYLTTAYLGLVVSGGRGASVRVEYAENFWCEPELKTKGSRDEIEGKHWVGLSDEFVPDGGKERMFEPVWWRTYRFVKLKIETQSESLTLEDIYGLATSYPFERRAQFLAAPKEFAQILDVGWRTARLCAHETYVDCPYYEQLQYAGDTRIQAMVSLYMAGDDRLMRNAISQFDDSRSGAGLTASRFPSSVRQYIPQFSLLWIGMVRDHLYYQDDAEYVRGLLLGIRQVLACFERYLTPDRSVGQVPYWAYFDWVNQWSGGVPPGWNRRPNWSSKPGDGVPLSDPRGASSLFDWTLALGCEWASDIERAVGSVEHAARNMALAKEIRSAAKKRYWDEARQLFADTAGKETFSQHANTLAVLNGIVTGADARALMERVLSDASLAQASIHWLYYVHLALREAGLADRYAERLDLWRRMLARGLTTWEEVEEPSRSECHAWGSSPNVELFRILLGIDSAAPGWKRVRIAPALGNLGRASGRVPHPRGEVGVKLVVEGNSLLAEVDLPPGVDGELVWGGVTRPLTSGLSEHRIEPI